MAIAATIRRHLEEHGVKYDVIVHEHTASSMRTAEAAHVPGDKLAKTVVLKDGAGYLMAVLPATHHLDIERLNELVGRELTFVEEEELATLFADCEAGAVPAAGAAYHMQVALDKALTEESDIYFEAGDHREVIHVSGTQFQSLQGKAVTGYFSYHI